MIKDRSREQEVREKREAKEKERKKMNRVRESGNEKF
jgi:hypothetical protein